MVPTIHVTNDTNLYLKIDPAATPEKRDTYLRRLTAV